MNIRHQRIPFNFPTLPNHQTTCAYSAMRCLVISRRDRVSEHHALQDIDLADLGGTSDD